MKVKELIEKLQAFDPEKLVSISISTWDEGGDVTNILTYDVAAVIEEDNQKYVSNEEE